MSNVREADPAAVSAARDHLHAHLQEMVAWHFDPATGTPFWIDWAAENGFDAVAEITTMDDLAKLPRFDDEWLRKLPHERFLVRGMGNRPFRVFETGGTTGMPKQRIAWDDHEYDYEMFSETLDETYFPMGANWLMAGPTGPRRLRLAVEHLANHRGGSCYFIDLDPRWVKKLIKNGDYKGAEAYKDHVVDQVSTLLRHRDIECMFSTPKLLESMAERFSIPGMGIKGVFGGGTQMTPQILRFLCEEVLENKAQLVPTYGNTLMGLAASVPLAAEDNYSCTYHAPQPRAALRVVDPDNPDNEVGYDELGRVELTTLTKELFMPRFLERDEALRRRPHELYPWDGVGEVKPFGASTQKIVEGVY
jgi:phenylacetate-coenzyme A ligase PaaK-like adenylate-forming protein